MIYWYFLQKCWRRSIREHPNEICSFRTEALHEQFCLHLHLLYRMREMETNAFGPVPPTNTELSPCKSCHWQAKTSNFCKWLLWQGQKCVIFGCQLSRASLGGSCRIGHCSSFHGSRKQRARVCVCVRSALRRAQLQDNRARRSLPHLSPESPTPAVERRGTASDGELTLNHPTFHLLCLSFICGLICNITPFALTDEPAVILKAGQWHKGLKLLQPACNIWASVAPSICTLNGIYRSLQLFTVIHAMENIWDERVYQSCRQSFLEIP